MSEIKCFIGCRIIKAKESTYGEYRKEKYNDAAYGVIDDNAKGYMVFYPAIGEGSRVHVSWSPKAVFEKAYREIDPEESMYIASV